MSETATGVKWETVEENDGLIYRSNGFIVRIRSENWWVKNAVKIIEDNYAPDFATAKQQAERWILEREGRLPAPATDGGGWIACSERMPEVGQIVELIARGHYDGRYLTSYPEIAAHWRPLPVDPHKDAACLFDEEMPVTARQIRAAARHVAGCAECRAKLEAKGGA